MNNLVIIGNGFDLAHGLKSSYTDFIKHIINSKFEDQKLYNNLFSYESGKYNYGELIATIHTSQAYTNGIKWHNHFFYRMILNSAHNNWCDIERLYYKELQGNNYQSPKKLNDEFEIIKGYLEDYLEKEKNKFNVIPLYNNLFSRLQNAEKTFLLNFNYTDTVKKYNEVSRNLTIVNIHGELKSEINPIVFGFAADDSQSRTLVDKDDKEYMRNIKKHCYKKTKNQNKLINYLETTEKIDVLILGHSCGISDKLILNQIFNHKNINSIRIFYHEEHEKYFETQVNIDRIMNNDKHFEKLLNFEESYKMPQFNDEASTILGFETYIVTLLNEQKTKKRLGPRVY